MSLSLMCQRALGCALFVALACSAAAQPTALRLEPVQVPTEHELPDEPGSMTVEFDAVDHDADLGLLIIRGRQTVRMSDGRRPSYRFGSGAFEARFLQPPPPPPGPGSEAVVSIPAYTASGRPDFDGGAFLIALPLGGEFTEEHAGAIAISFHHRAAESKGYRVVAE